MLCHQVLKIVFLLTRNPQQCCVYIVGFFCVPISLSNDIMISFDPTRDPWHNYCQRGHTLKARLTFLEVKFTDHAVRFSFHRKTESWGLWAGGVFITPRPARRPRKMPSVRATPEEFALAAKKVYGTPWKLRKTWEQTCRWRSFCLTGKVSPKILHGYENMVIIIVFNMRSKI